MLVVDTNAISLELDGSEIKLEFLGSYSHIWVENIGSSTISVSRTPDIANQDSGVIQRPPKSSVGMQVANSTIYISGDSGTVNVMGTNSAENPFKIVGEGGGGSISGGTTDYNDLDNKPKIGGVTLEGDKSLEDLGISQSEGGSSDVTNVQNKLHVESRTVYVPWNTIFNVNTNIDFKKPMEGTYGVFMNGMFSGSSNVYLVGAQRIYSGKNYCTVIPKTDDMYWSSRGDYTYFTIMCVENLD